MGAVLGLLGVGGGGSDFKAQAADIIDPFSPKAPAAVQQANNQGLATTQGLIKTAGQVAPAAAVGVANQNDVYGKMTNLGNDLTAASHGEGPNPALAQLANTTGQNIAATTAAMAGARGAAANPGLIAREAAQQGAATQQQAVGQGAVLSAEQQIAARQQLQQQQAAQAGLATTQVGEGVNAATTAANAGQTYQQLQNAILQNYNAQNLANVQQQNNANAGVQQQAVSGGSKFTSGLLGGIGSAIGLAPGGEVPETAYVAGQPRSAAGRALMAKGGVASLKSSGGHVPGTAKVKGDSYANDTVPAKLSPGEIVLPRSVTKGPNPARDAAAFVAAVMAKKVRR